MRVAKLMPATTHSNTDSLPRKDNLYGGLSDLNRNFEQVLFELERLKTCGLFRTRFQRDSLATCRATIEETCAWLNFAATESLHEQEERDRAHFGRIRRRLEKKYEDPHDVLIEAERFKNKIARRGRRSRPSVCADSVRGRRPGRRSESQMPSRVRSNVNMVDRRPARSSASITR